MATSPMLRVDTVITGTAGAPFYSRQYFDAGATTPATCAGKVRTFWDTIKTQIDAALTITIQPVVYTVDPVLNQITGSTAVAGIAPTAGTASDEALPYANQGILQHNTGVYIAGKPLRGRTFIPGMTQLANNDGTTTPSYQNVIQSAAGIMTTPSAVVYSPTHRVWYSVSDNVVKPKIGVLRSRRD